MAENINKDYVVDASFILAFLLPDEHAPEVDQKFELYSKKLARFTSTYLLPFEVLNALKSAVLRKRIDIKLATKLASVFLAYKIRLIEIEPYKAFLIALKHNISVYDASYTHLAKVSNLPLLTQDKSMKEALWEELEMKRSKTSTTREKTYRFKKVT
jgi:predicted nucleic acid-binding protein